MPGRLSSVVSSILLLVSASGAHAQEAAPSFRNQIQPILARYGCSSGACHGSAAGQGGFRLSLRGYDDAGDYLSITRSAQGRRVTLEDPARSLLLLKATKRVPHKGGRRSRKAGRSIKCSRTGSLMVPPDPRSRMPAFSGSP
ncbi:hypothetical protein [Verrucomicrobium spinosum]|uniref:hypothetical protein n=1 Tax=Verrucomicrobium spinosum TaxID=2736 RepID=UPI001C450296|nr:hypothetical protein [Verrucomicrobium spinosum]